MSSQNLIRIDKTVIVTRMDSWLKWLEKKQNKHKTHQNKKEQKKVSNIQFISEWKTSQMGDPW